MAARTFCLLFVLPGVLGVPGLAGDSDIDRATLRGLTSIKVVIDQPPPEMEQEGLDREHLRATMEQKLRDGGIKIDNDAVEFLGLAIATARSGRRSPLALVMNLGLFQVVTLNRDKTTKTVAETWGAQRLLSVAPKGRVPIVSSKGGDRETVDAVEGLLDQFVKAYQAVNPK